MEKSNENYPYWVALGILGFIAIIHIIGPGLYLIWQGVGK